VVNNEAGGTEAVTKVFFSERSLTGTTGGCHVADGCDITGGCDLTAVDFCEFCEPLTADVKLRVTSCRAADDSCRRLLTTVDAAADAKQNKHIDTPTYTHAPRSDTYS